MPGIPSEGICNWCRAKPGDIFCDGWPCCYDCIEVMIEQENALYIADKGGVGQEWRSDFYDSLRPIGWDK